MDILNTQLMIQLINEIIELIDNDVMQIYTDLKSIESQLLKKWLLLYKRCNPLDYLINAQQYKRPLKQAFNYCLELLLKYKDYNNELKLSLNQYIDQQDVTKMKECIKKFHTCVSQFIDTGILCISNDQIYKLEKFIQNFTTSTYKLKLNNISRIKILLDELTKVYESNNELSTTPQPTTDKPLSFNTTTTITTITPTSTTTTTSEDLNAMDESLTQNDIIQTTIDLRDIVLLLDVYSIIQNYNIRTILSKISNYLQNQYYNDLLTLNVDSGINVNLPKHLRKAFRIIPICGDGSCFYNALSVQMCGTTDLSLVLRTILVYYMIINESWIIKNFYISNNTSFKTLLINSLNSTEYIDDTYPPIMMSLILKRPINIYGQTLNQFIRINPSPVTDTKIDEFFLYLHDNHYTALAQYNRQSKPPPLNDYKLDDISNSFARF